MRDKIKELLGKITSALPAESGELGYVNELTELIEDLLTENKILDLMVNTSDAATKIINDQELHRLLLEFYDIFTAHFAPDDYFKIDVDFDPEDEINEDRIVITVLTKSDDIQGYSDKYFLVYRKLDEARKLLAPKCKYIGFSVQYTE